MAIIAVLARVDNSVRYQIEREWLRCDGVSLVDVDQRDRLGVVIERDTIAAAEAFLQQRIETTPGVLCAWPVFVHYGDEAGGDEAYGDEAAAAADPLIPSRHARPLRSSNATHRTAE